MREMMNLAEIVFSMLKVRVGGSLQSRKYWEQRRELLLKAVLYNVSKLDYLEFDGR